MQVRVIGVLFACLLILGAGGGLAASELRVTGVSHGGPALVNTTTDTKRTYLWESKSETLHVNVQSGNTGGIHQFCVRGRPADAGDKQGNMTTLDCQVVSFKPNNASEVTFQDLSPPKNASGRYRLYLVIQSQPNGGKEILNYSNTTVTYISKSGDLDKDGLSNAAEVNNSTLIDTADTDGDNLDDGKEVKIGTNPRKADSDGDGFRDGLEVSLGTNPNNPWVPDVFPILFVVVLLIAIPGGFYVVRRYGFPPSFDRGGESGPTDRQPPGDGPSPPPSAADSSSEPSESVAPDTVLTDEDRILQLLAQNDGRLMQSELVERTGWSKSKVSRRLSSLEEENRVSKISLGRQNIVTLPGKEPEGTRSPLDE